MLFRLIFGSLIGINVLLFLKYPVTPWGVNWWCPAMGGVMAGLWIATEIEIRR